MTALGADQVRALFRQESDTRLAHLGKLLLELEQSGHDKALIDSIFRDVHTIKGSAAVAGMDTVSRVAHELEELVDGVRAGRTAPTPALVDDLLAGADRLAAAILGGGSGNARVAATLPPATDPAPRAPRQPEAGTFVTVPMERLDELVRLVGESASQHLRVGRLLQERFKVDPASCAEYNELSLSLNQLQDRTMRARMVPVSLVTDQLHRTARDLARAQDKEIAWEVRGGETELDRGVLNGLSDSLLHLVRNAVDHGVEPPDARVRAGKPRCGHLRLHAMQLGPEVTIAVSDDGPGIDIDQVRLQAGRQGVDTGAMSDDDVLRLVFLSALSTTSAVTDVSGRGVGLDVVRASVEAANGRVDVWSKPGAGTEFRIIVPVTLAVMRCLLVEAAAQRFALPFHRVVACHDTGIGEVRAEGKRAVWVDRRPVPVSALAEVLAAGAQRGPGPLVVLSDAARRHAFQVDRLVGQRDVVLKGLSPLLPALPAVAGASVEPDGSVLLVLDPPGLIHRARHQPVSRATAATVPGPGARRRRVLIVDDALTVRELQRSILARAGFDVQVAGDGAQALASLASAPSDLVLTDIEMPTMDGFALTEAIRAHPTLANIPVLILSSRSSDADRQRGLDAGADGYILKNGFDEGSLLAAVNRLLGGAS